MLNPITIRRNRRIRHDWQLRSHLTAAEKVAAFLVAVTGADYQPTFAELCDMPRQRVVHLLRKARIDVRSRRYGTFAGVVRHGRGRYMFRPGADPVEAFGSLFSSAEPELSAILPRARLPATMAPLKEAGTNQDGPPGAATARSYLNHVTRSGDRAFKHAMIRAAGTEPAVDDGWVVKPTPTQALDALMILQLGQALAVAGRERTVLWPDAGMLTVIAVAGLAARKRLSVLLPELVINGRDAPLVFYEGSAATREKSIAEFHAQLEDAMLTGRGVVAIVGRPEAVPATLQALAGTNLVLVPPDGATIAALLDILHPGQKSVIDVPAAAIARLSQTHLASVLAATDAEAAQARLHQVVAALHPASQTTLAAVYGQPEAVAALAQVVTDLDDWRGGRVAWDGVTRSFLLMGPPGTGKTLLAHALAGSTGAAFIKTSYSQCQSSGHQGDMLKALYAAGETAITSTPSVFFIDEIDSFFVRGQSLNGYIIGVVNGLLTLIDRLLSTPGVILLAATNNRDRVDPAVIRAGRFDRHIHVGHPDRAGIATMLKAALPALLSQDEVATLQDQLLGLTGAEIAAMLRDARTRARAARRDVLGEDVRQAADACMPQPDPALMWRIAVHEAGHLLAGHLLGLEKATRAQLSTRGGFVARPTPGVTTQATVPVLLQMKLAGRVAERLFFDDVSSGGGVGQASDLAQATQMALQAEANFGFGPSLTWHTLDRPLTLMPLDVRGRVEARLQEAQADVMHLLDPHRLELERIAMALLERRELNAADLDDLLAGNVPTLTAAKPAGPSERQFAVLQRPIMAAPQS